VTTIEALLNNLETDAPVHQVLVGAFWTAVVLDTDPPRCGLASTLRAETHHKGPPVPRAGRLLEHSGRELAEWLRSPRLLEASIGMAALNALLDVDEAACTEVNAEDVILRRGTGRRVAIVGHFPFVERVRQAAEVCWVLELRPRLGDLSAGQANRVLPRADVVIWWVCVVPKRAWSCLGPAPRCRRFCLSVGWMPYPGPGWWTCLQCCALWVRGPPFARYRASAC
jgi:uncharacterized protein (DUF4213/DUF364 family)